MGSPGAGFSYPREEIAAAARAARSAADQAGGIDLGGAAEPITAAMPGSAAGPAASELSESWRLGLQAWAANTAQHSDDLAAASQQMSQTDSITGTALDETLFGGVLDR